jgi:hypothetical protein
LFKTHKTTKIVKAIKKRLTFKNKWRRSSSGAHDEGRKKRQSTENKNIDAFSEKITLFAFYANVTTIFRNGDVQQQTLVAVPH